MDRNRVITVTPEDIATGDRDKMEAHQEGILHRAFSIFLQNNKGELLLQQRADGKYHSGGLWTNTCCSHPMPGEGTLEAAIRRLQEEMGVIAPLAPAFQFTYRADVGGGLIEHELDHVFTGLYSGQCTPHPDEVKDWRYVPLQALEQEIAAAPETFTTWMRIAFPLYLAHLSGNKPA
ncbi:MAG: isopentenyl-diphosphate Delta-isomerase [Flavipsychrobacter sp.]|nr:isopentenyl-diphosphate Delta-isomerase [Flavipsychrobacter sp.]